MATSEDYLKEHNIKSVSMMSDGTSAPVMLIKIDDDVLRVSMTQDMISNMRNGNSSDIDSVMADTVYDYEQKKKMEERGLKLDDITRRMNGN